MKIKTSVTIDEDLVKWIDGEINKKRFANRSHAVEFALYHIKNIE
jgi:Arc/MetJ-type ribon-helix-helix transcriptional regulator